MAVLSLGLMLSVGACVLNPQPEPPDHPGDAGHAYAAGGSGAGGNLATPGGGGNTNMTGTGGSGAQSGYLDASNNPVPNVEAGKQDRDGAADAGTGAAGAGGGPGDAAVDAADGAAGASDGAITDVVTPDDANSEVRPD